MLEIVTRSLSALLGPAHSATGGRLHTIDGTEKYTPRGRGRSAGVAD